VNAEMRQILAEASIMAEGPAMNWSPRTSHGKASAVILVRHGDSLLEEIEKLFASAYTPEAERRVVAVARQMIHNAKRTPAPTNGMAEPGSTPWKREVAAAVDECKTADQVGQVARRFSISRATAYRIRAMYSEKDERAA
jgi:hypothetical protein